MKEKITSIESVGSPPVCAKIAIYPCHNPKKWSLGIFSPSNAFFNFKKYQSSEVGLSLARFQTAKSQVLQFQDYRPER